jgi:hypothetical protein
MSVSKILKLVGGEKIAARLTSFFVKGRVT